MSRPLGSCCLLRAAQHFVVAAADLVTIRRPALLPWTQRHSRRPRRGLRQRLGPVLIARSAGPASPESWMGRVATTTGGSDGEAAT
jgi:hypothetical protein